MKIGAVTRTASLLLARPIGQPNLSGGAYSSVIDSILPSTFRTDSNRCS